MGSSNAVALLAAGLLLLLLGAAPSAATSGGREQSRYPPPRGGGKYVRRPPGNSSGKGDSHEPSAQPVDPTISVVGVDVLSPEDVQQYRQAHITYWRTVLSKPADASPVNPSPPKPLPNFACPKATESTYADYGRAQNGKGSKGKASRAPDTYLITGSIFGPNTTFPIRRSCTLPPGRRVILNIYNDFEWYSPPLDYSLSGLVPAGVRLSPASISSLAQASSAVNASACVFITINGTQVPDIASFYQVSPFVSDMDIAPGFYQLLRDVLGVNLNGTAAGRLYRNGIRRTDFADAGYYLIFPRGLPRGRHTIRFGIRPNCTTLATSFFRGGTQYDNYEQMYGNGDGGSSQSSHKGDGGRKSNGKQDEGRDGRYLPTKDEGKCWPFPDTCGTDCLPLAAGNKAAFSWEYVVTVE